MEINSPITFHESPDHAPNSISSSSAGTHQGVQGLLAFTNATVKSQVGNSGVGDPGVGNSGAENSGGGNPGRGKSQGGKSAGVRSNLGKTSRTETNPDKDLDGNAHSVKFVALGMRLVNADTIQPAMKYAFATTVAENLQSYSSRERKQIGEAMNMAEKLAYPSAGKAIEFVNSGSVNDIPVTAHDVARAYEVYGTPI